MYFNKISLFKIFVALMYLITFRVTCAAELELYFSPNRSWAFTYDGGSASRAFEKSSSGTAGIKEDAERKALNNNTNIKFKVVWSPVSYFLFYIFYVNYLEWFTVSIILSRWFSNKQQHTRERWNVAWGNCQCTNIFSIIPASELSWHVNYRSCTVYNETFLL